MHAFVSLTCPYKGCGKSFDKPVVLTDCSTLPRETYYACPHCLSKLEILVGGSGDLVSVKASESPVDVAPSRCPHFFGYLKTFSEEASIPDECLTCSKIMQCFVKK